MADPTPMRAAPAARDKLAEQAHFRLDELERQLSQNGSMMGNDGMNAIVRGAVMAMQAQMQASLAKLTEDLAELTRMTAEDLAADKQVVVALHELVEQMRKPKTARLDLPGGPVTVSMHCG